MVNSTGKEAFEALYQQYAANLLLYINSMLRSRAEAEDVLQALFVQVWERLNEGKMEAENPVWLYKKARYLCLDTIRQRSRRVAREEAFAQQAYFEGNGLEGAGLEAKDLVEKLLLEGVKEQVEVIILKLWGGRTFEEIGDILAIAPNTAASRYRYGLERMRKVVKEAQLA